MFSKAVLQLDIPVTIGKIAETLRAQVMGVLHKRGVVVGLSGGIDSSVVAALAVRALGKERVLGLFMPEKDSSDDSLRLGQLVAGELGINTVTESIGAALAALGCYERQNEALRRLVPDFAAGWRFKLALPSIMDGPVNSAGARLNVTQLTVQKPNGETQTQRMPIDVYLQIVAATNYKQRVRKMTEYYHGDRLNYAVTGTPNRLEYDQGFFVKQGDGAADVKPIAHLYKTQVYALAEQLGIPAEIRSRPPTTDTFSMPQTQEEFYFSLPYDRMDVCLYAFNHGAPAAEVASALDLTEEQVQRVFKDIAQKRKTTAYLHARPLLVEAVDEV